MAFKYPFGKMQQLNLDWFIKQWGVVKSEYDSLVTQITTIKEQAEAALSQISGAIAQIANKLDKYNAAGVHLYGSVNGQDFHPSLPLEISYGGTGASNPSDARDNLGMTAELAKKIDKRTTAGNFLYSHSDNVQSEKGYQSYPTADFIVMFNGAGNVQTGTPTLNIEAANKKYVDDEVDALDVHISNKYGNVAELSYTVVT